MKFSSRHIKSQFVLQIGFFVLYSIAVMLIVFLTYRQIERKRNAEMLILNLKHNLSHSYTAYGNFMLNVNNDDQLFLTGKNVYTSQFSVSLENLTDSINLSFQNNSLKEESANRSIKDSVISAISKYKNSFNYITLAILERGMKGYGNINAIQGLSDKILQHFAVSKNPEFFLLGIKLKSLESDFNYAYNLRDYNSLVSLLDEISNEPSLGNATNPDNQELLSLVASYSSKIQYQNNTIQQLGADDSGKGLIAEFEENYKDLKYSFNKYAALHHARIHSVIVEWKVLALVIFILITLLYILLIWKLLIRIRGPLLQSIDFSYHLSKGKLPAENLPTEGHFEFSNLNNSLNRIKASVKDKQIFIENLLKQKFDIDLSLQGKNDTFGKTLLALKENMRKARDEQLKYAEEYQLRRYLNEGIAKFSEILRSNSDNLHKLSDEFIRELVRYLEAMQGGLFLTLENNEQELSLESAFAYDRKKYLKKTIAPGEGLIGACALEKKSINLTELPADYLEITSGLGEAPPNNLLLLPVMNEGTLIGVIEIASLKKFETHQIEVGEIIASSLASTIIAGRINRRTAELLEKSQQQAAEMAEQEEEMRQNLEELKATQEESARREEEMEGIINALSHSFCLLEYDLTGRISKVNQKVLTLLSLSSENVLGKSHSEIFGKGSKVDSVLFTQVIDGTAVELIEKVKINNKPVELSNTFLPIHSKTGTTVKIINIMSVNF